MIELFGAGFDYRDPEWRRQPARTTAYAIALITSGNLVYKINDVVLQLGKDDLLFIPIDCIREGFHSGDDYHQKYWATFLIKGPSAHILPLLTESVPQVIKSRQHDYMKQRFAQLIQQWMGKLPYHETICSSILTEMLGVMNRDLDDKHHPSPMLNLVGAIQDYVLSHYREEIRVDRLAKLLDRTPNYVSSVYKRLTGMSLVDYIHQVKVSVARDMLFHQDVSIGQAAEYVGFCDQAYFNRVFKKIYGFPPSVLLKERGRSKSRITISSESTDQL
ncbi:helix-turn-helix domain-containing protein [Paenibacillus sp. strain BS8-2]